LRQQDQLKIILRKIENWHSVRNSTRGVHSECFQKEKLFQPLDFEGEFFDDYVQDPRKIERECPDESLEKMFLVIIRANEVIKKLKKYVDVGFTEIVLTGSQEERFSKVDGRRNYFPHQ
jgi:hypothetical protein